MAVLAVAAISARMLAEAAARDGYDVAALDLFGDADTRRVATLWRSIGAAGSLQLDGARMLDALQEVARLRGDAVIGWIPGSGFEGRPDLLAAGAQLLPLIGTSADAVRRVRDPVEFFGVLAAHGIAHPEVRTDAPADPQGWLLKDAGGQGGWHIRDAASARSAAPGGSSRYFQRAMRGVPMSATFIGAGDQATLWGLNELIVRPLGTRPHVYAGCIGPVDVASDLARRIDEIVRQLTAAFGLRGWCSLDFIRDGDAIGVLEVNPRPPASLALYAQPGLIDAQLRACLHAELPPPAVASRPVRGSEIVYAKHALTLAPAAAQHLARRPDVHDLPSAGARFALGDPICSLSAQGDRPEQVKALLDAARDDLMHTLEIPS
ncbi:MAG TPA: ATP-grasp domain-containing protein [Burkholderiaceae bacterium]|nr:ATP-grasp domain-containing protein [Burkholderiaceae bacterium]